MLLDLLLPLMMLLLLVEQRSKLALDLRDRNCLHSQLLLRLDRLQPPLLLEKQLALLP
jgi:hypothetical protein